MPQEKYILVVDDEPNIREFVRTLPGKARLQSETCHQWLGSTGRV